MEVSTALLAEYISYSINKRPNILGVYNDIEPQGWPHIVPCMHMLLIFEAGLEEVGQEYQFCVELIDPDGRIYWQFKDYIMINLRNDPARPYMFNQTLTLYMVKFFYPGDYRFVISVEGSIKRTINFRVHNVPEENQNE